MLESKKDIKIMQQIIENARIPVTILAKKTGLSKEVVQYRIKNLEKNLISGYQARINLAYFADAVYTLYLNIQSIERESAVAKLKKLPLVHWIGNSAGRWNYIVTFSVNKEKHLKNFINHLFDSFSSHHVQYTLTQHIVEYKDTFASLFGIEELKVSEKSTSEKIKLDEMDKRIIDELTKNACISNLQIAHKLKTTRETVRKRIIRLEKNEVILNYRTLIKPTFLGLENYVLAIKCKNANTNHLTELCKFFSHTPGCSYICITAGEINILVTLSVKNLKELDEISTKAQKEFQSLIREIEPIPLFEIGSQQYNF